MVSVVQPWLRNQLGSNCIVHYESQCANTGTMTSGHKAIILKNCWRALALSCCKIINTSLAAYPGCPGIPCIPSESRYGANQNHTTPHHTKEETAADLYLFWHSAGQSAGSTCFSAAGSNLPSFWMSGSQMIKVHPKPQGLVENSPGFKTRSPASAWMCHGSSARKMHMSAFLQS